jgi:hypothetical protein
LYKFKVRAKCGGNQSDWSEWVFFNGGSNGGGGGTGGGACAAPTLLSANVNGTSAILSWNAVSGATQYTVEVEDEQNVPSTFQIETSVSGTSYTVTGLQSGVLYKFKVRTQCGGNQSDWSEWLFFNGNIGSAGGSQSGGNTGDCARPSGAIALDITSTSALLTWNPVPGAASYLLEIERNQPGAAPWQITQVVTTNAFTISGLAPNTRYKFKVRTNCSGGGHSGWSKWRKFKTAASLYHAGDDRDDIVTAENALKTLVLEAKVSPNPVQTTATLRLNGLVGETTSLRWFDLRGQLLRELELQTSTGTWSGPIEAPALGSGLYLLQVHNGQQTQVLKIVIAH